MCALKVNNFRLGVYITSMDVMLKVSLLLAMVLSSHMGQAQSNVLDTTHVWVSLKNIDLYTDQTLPDTFHITINRTSLVLKNGGLEMNCNVENVQGLWSSLSEVGQLSFDIPLRDFKGKGLIKNEDGVLSLTIDFSERKDWMKRKFIIKN